MENNKIERVQTGVRMEKKTLKVLKALSEYYDTSLGNLLEGIVLYVFEGKLPFKENDLKKIEALKKIYDMELTASTSHHMIEDIK